jgi:hypothetical protein
VPARADGGDGLADWVELTFLSSRKRSTNPAIILDGLRRQGGAWAEQDISHALNAMSRRERLCGSGYPYSVKTVGVRRTSTDMTAYDALLLMSREDGPFHDTPAGLHEATVVLERLTQAAMVGLLGPATRSVRFAWPSDEGRPPLFPDAIRWLGGRMGISLGQSYRPPRRKDGGVDVVAWRPFDDGRRGFPVVLVQCTLERDYVHKSRDIDLRTWSGWLAFDADPLTALALPFTVSSDETWNEMAANVIVLDRVRLTRLLSEAAAEAPAETTWATAELDRTLARGAIG